LRRQIDVLSDEHSSFRIIWSLAWPIMLEQVLIMLVQYVDTAMVGAIGPDATAAVALTSSTNWLMNGILAGVAIGFGVPVGNYIGANKIDRARAVVRQSVLAIALFGLALTAIMLCIAPYLPHWLGGEESICADATRYISIVSLAYIATASVQICSNILRCTGDTATPLIFNVSTNVINMVLNFLLIYEPREITIFGSSFRIWGAGLGVSGAAIATAAATFFSGFMLLRAMFLDKFRCSISLKQDYRFDKAIWADMVKVGSPVTFERVCISAGQILMTAMVTSLGTASLAAHSLGITAESITYMPAFGFSAAATTLVAQSLGAGRKDKAKSFSTICVTGCVIMMSCLGVVLYFGGGAIISLFTPSEEVVEIGAAALKVEALAQPFFALANCISGAFRGARKTKWLFMFGLAGMWAVRLPICFVLTKYTTLGLTGAWIGMAADLTVRGLVSLVMYRGDKWLQLPEAAKAEEAAE
jgi:putative MATE family efflux protein